MYRRDCKELTSTRCSSPGCENDTEYATIVRMKKLPIGIQTFRKIIEENYLYIDKTKEITTLLETGQTFFLTGVSKFSKVSVFSGLNNILDITIDERFSTILCITDSELIDYCIGYLELLEKKQSSSRNDLHQSIDERKE